MTFGGKLLRLRRARNWTQEELAGQIDVTRQALSKWESDSALPDTKNVVALAKLFGVTTDYLFRDDEGAESETLSRDEETRGESIVKSNALGLILLALGFAGLFALGIAGSFFDTVWVTSGREYRYMAAMLHANKFLILLLVLAAASAAAGAVLLIRRTIRKKLGEYATIQAEIRAMRDKASAALKRGAYDSVKDEIHSMRENEEKNNTEET